MPKDSIFDKNSNEITEEGRLLIRQNISSLSFEELLKIKEEMGAKLYNKTLFDTTTKGKASVNFKRANKNRPREVSSKVKPKGLNLESVSKKKIMRDPRFDPLCGHFDAKKFDRNYRFINDIRINEKSQLEREMQRCSDPKKQKIIKPLLQRMDNQIREKEKYEKEQQKLYEEKKEIKDKLKRGEKPVFMKKSVKKIENLIEKYEQLKKANKLEKHIQRRSKKIAIKEKKKLKEPQFEN